LPLVSKEFLYVAITSGSRGGGRTRRAQLCMLYHVPVWKQHPVCWFLPKVAIHWQRLKQCNTSQHDDHSNEHLKSVAIWSITHWQAWFPVSLCLLVVLRLSILLAGVDDESIIVCLPSTFLHRWLGAFTPPTRTFIGSLISSDIFFICTTCTLVNDVSCYWSVYRSKCFLYKMWFLYNLSYVKNVLFKGERQG